MVAQVFTVSCVVQDMKLLYREQIDFMATQLEVGQGSG